MIQSRGQKSAARGAQMAEEHPPRDRGSPVRLLAPTAIGPDADQEIGVPGGEGNCGGRRDRQTTALDLLSCPISIHGAIV